MRYTIIYLALAYVFIKRYAEKAKVNYIRSQVTSSSEPKWRNHRRDLQTERENENNSLPQIGIEPIAIVRDYPSTASFNATYLYMFVRRFPY